MIPRTMKNYLYLSFLIVIFGCKDQASHMDRSIAFIGTYTQTEGHVDGKGAGILIYEAGPSPNDWRLLSIFSDIINPSYLCISPVNPIIYAVSEQGPDAPEPGSVIKVIKYDEIDFQMVELQSIDALGDAPCYISTSIDGRQVFVANYITGNVVAYDVNDDGTLDSGVAIQASGSGPHPRQEGPHAHFIKPHPYKDEIYGVDLGTDIVTKYESKKDFLVIDSIKVEAGSGPRHLVWGPNGENVYILSELSGTIEHWLWNHSVAERRSITSLVPQGDTRDPGAADLHISNDGKFLYASLRGGFDEIIVLALDPTTQKPSIVQRLNSGGEAPRNFAVSPDDTYLVVASQNSDKLTIFSRDSITGKLQKKPIPVEVLTPVCVVFK